MEAFSENTKAETRESLAVRDLKSSGAESGNGLDHILLKAIAGFGRMIGILTRESEKVLIRIGKQLKRETNSDGIVADREKVSTSSKQAGLPQSDIGEETNGIPDRVQDMSDNQKGTEKTEKGGPESALAASEGTDKNNASKEPEKDRGKKGESEVNQADASANQADASANQADASANQADASANQADASANQADASALPANLADLDE